MKIQEFKAWFEGFTENLEGTPNEMQWKKIQKRVKEIDDAPITERIFIDRYWKQYEKIYPEWPNYYRTVCGGNPKTYSSSTAMYALGKADAA